MEKKNRIKEIFDLYTSDLSFDEIERLIKHDSPEVFQYFAKDIGKQDDSHNKLIRFLLFARNLFNAFLLKLTPARRIIYISSIIIIIIGFIYGITSYIILSFLLVNLLLAFELADKLTTKDDLTLAKNIQENLIPQNPPKLDSFDISTYYKSAREVSGDYFDFIHDDSTPGEHYLVIGDISGKGLASALYMVRVQAILHSLINDYKSIKDILCNLNRYFSKNLSSGYFLTLMLARINGSKSVTFSRAGHTPLVVYNNKTDSFTDYNPKGLGIGLNNGSIFDSSIEEITVIPESGDILFFYTDGVSEAMNSNRQEYGIGKVKNIIKNNKNKTVDEISKIIEKSLSGFRGTTPVNDDITYILMKTK
jgi:sigma-B regulation protein RsbU (phosphoserine phosphatase)